jgi:hypothetical protein
MEQNETPAQKPKASKGAIIIGIIALLLALGGVGLGIYGMIDGNAKSNKISDLQKQVDDLEATISELKTAIAKTTSTGSRIKIISSSWSGWSADYKPEEKESFCKLNLGGACSTDDGELSFTITNIDDNSVTIHTSEAFSDKEDGINLLSDKQDFTIKKGESLKLETPTMDAGFTYKLSIVAE